MSFDFTEHLKNFGLNRPLQPDLLAGVEQHLKQRMRRRGLLTAPPKYLGYDVPRWRGPDAFSDIVVDCYVFAVLDRIEALRNQLLVCDNVDGYVARNIDNFLFERQKRYDPLGYAAFRNVVAAVIQAREAGWLSVGVAPGERLSGRAVVQLAETAGTAPLADLLGLAALVEDAPGWNDILPHLARITELGQEWLTALLCNLKTGGIGTFRVRDLVAVIAVRARKDWIARHATPPQDLAEEGNEEFGQLVRWIAPDQSLEHRDRWEMLKREVPKKIAGLDRQERVRARLARLFSVLVKAIDSKEGAVPTQVELTRQLGVPRSTVSDDFRLLETVLKDLLER